MKLFVQIPCLNEQLTLTRVIHDIPRRIDGIDETKVLIVDDGSTDNTAEIATSAGADYVVRIPTRQGLARAFSIGLNRCLELGADIIVNTDGDHQYDGKDIPRLIQPILEGKADIVIGDRQPATLRHFSLIKRRLQALGSRTLSLLSRIDVPDATSGFRAYSREAALKLNVFSKFTYTLETLIQAGNKHLVVSHVPVRANGPTRASRLFPSLATYLKKSISTLLRIYALYEPLRTFFYIGSVIFLSGIVGLLRFLYYWFDDQGGHVQSLVVSGVLLVIGFQAWMLGLLADLISVNRRLSEEMLYRMKKQDVLAEHDGVVTPRKTSKTPGSPKDKVTRAW